jgi:hypothetical protein
MAITKIADIPFVERDAARLLALDVDRVSPDADYAGFGWTAVDEVVLTAPDRGDIVVQRPVVVALHSADEQPDDGGLDLLFEVGDQSLVVGLAAFTPHMLARLPADRPIVLALCNPKRVAIAGRDAVTIHWAHGDVTSWLDDPTGTPRLRLTARRWFCSASDSSPTKDTP